MKTWGDMKVVQPLASRIIINSILKKRISHAYLIQGDRGTGKKTIASLLAKELFCEQKDGIEPCEQCKNCKRITSGNHPDVHWIEPDGASIKKEQIEHLQKEFTYSGLESSQKVYIIVSADALTLNAANRILKFLEEPSRKTTAILLTDNSQSIIPTIRSRSQIIDLQPMDPYTLQKKLIDHGLTESTARLMSALTNNIDEAMAMSEDEWFVQARKLMLQLIDMYVKNGDDAYLFVHQHFIPHFKERHQMEQGLDLLLLAFKDIFYSHINNEEMMVVFSREEKRLENATLRFSEEKLVRILQSILVARRKLKQNVQQTLVMEQLTLQIQR